MELINTIEICPYDYTDQEYISPASSWIETPDEWANFWYKCISDSGLQNLVPIAVGSYLVDINKINASELKVILLKQLADIDLEDYAEQVGQLYGGIVIKDKDDIVISPSCCGDIGNLNEWEAISGKEPNEWNQLWIGHPWIFYKRTKGVVEFSDYTDLELNDNKAIDVKYTLSEKELISALKTMRENQSAFKIRIADVLVELKISHAKEIASLLTGN